MASVNFSSIEEAINYVVRVGVKLYEVGITNPDENLTQHVHTVQKHLRFLECEQCIHKVPVETEVTREYRGTLYDAVLDVLSVLGITKDTILLTVKQKSKTETIPVEGSIRYYLPYKTTSYTYRFALVYPDYDHDATQGLKTKLFFFTSGSGILGVTINLTCYHVINMLNTDELLWFVSLSDPTFGYSYIVQYVPEAASVYELIKESAATARILQWVHQVLKRQIFRNLNYLTLALITSGKISEQDAEEYLNSVSAARALKSNTSSFRPYVIWTPYSVSSTTYHTHGEWTTVHTYSRTLSVNGIYQSTASSVREVKTRSILIGLGLYKMRVVETNTDQHVPIHRGVSIPCTNRDDIQKLAGKYTLKKKTKHFRGTLQGCNNVTDTVSAILRTLTKPNVVNGQVSLNATTGQFNGTLTTVGLK